MKRDHFLGFDPKSKWVFVFLFEDNIKKLSLFIEYLSEEDQSMAQQDLILYGLFWNSENTVDEMIDLFDINRSKKFGLKTWYEKH